MKPDGTYSKQNLSPPEFMAILPQGVKLRDLRTTSSRQISDFLVRANYTVIIIEHIMAFVSAKNLILMRANSNNVAELAGALSKALYKEASLPKNSPDRQPFEFVVLEEILEAISLEFETRLNLLIKVVDKVLHSISVMGYSESDDAVMRLIPLSRCLTNFQYSVKELSSSLETLLKTDQDIGLLCMTEKTQESRVEVELLLESYSKKFEEINNELTALQANIASTRTVIDMSLNSTRNYLMRLNLHIALSSMVFAAGALISGIFGMNLVSGLEESPVMFYVVACIIPLVGTALYSGYGAYYLKRQRHFRQLSRHAISSHFFDNINSLNYIKRITKTKNQEELKELIEEALGESITEEETNNFFSLVSRKGFLYNLKQKEEKLLDKKKKVFDSIDLDSPQEFRPKKNMK